MDPVFTGYPGIRGGFGSLRTGYGCYLTVETAGNERLEEPSALPLCVQKNRDPPLILPFQGQYYDKLRMMIMNDA